MDTEYKSRTQKKNEDKALQRLGEQLLGLQPGLLETMELPDELLQEIQFARKIKSHGARRRQIRHIGALLRHIDTQAIKTTLERMQSRKP
jgi:ribosome-associated protein